MNTGQRLPVSLGRLATLACLMEVTAPKPGNVHRSADFDGTSFFDFQLSAVLLGEVIDANPTGSLGRLVFDAVQMNQNQVGQNTNLGMILLLCPLVIAARNSNDCLDRDRVQTVLEQLTPDDCRLVFDAIQLAKPGGLNQSDKYDVSGKPPNDLIEAMTHAAQWDSVAKQYSSGFQTVFEVVIPAIGTGEARFERLSDAIVFGFTSVLSQLPDSLIARKCGEEVARHASFLAASAHESENDYWQRVSELDFWCRSDGNRRNPGTTADLIASALFVRMINGEMDLPRF